MLQFICRRVYDKMNMATCVVLCIVLWRIESWILSFSSATDECAYRDEAFRQFGLFFLVFVLILLKGNAADNAGFKEFFVRFGPSVNGKLSNFH